VLRKGDGTSHPTADSSCSCHYGGKLINGETFDSSYDRGSPTDFAPNQVIKGWTEAMQLMVEGDKWEMYIPSELGYGDGGSPPKIKGGDVLVFVMEIIKINGDKVDAIKCDPETKENCNEKESAYIDKMTKKFAGNVDGIKGELKRLEGMSSAKVKPELQQWMSRRCAPPSAPLPRPAPSSVSPACPAGAGRRSCRSSRTRSYSCAAAGQLLTARPRASPAHVENEAASYLSWQTAAGAEHYPYLTRSIHAPPPAALISRPCPRALPCTRRFRSTDRRSRRVPAR